MNPFNSEQWSERRQVLAVIVLACVAIFLLWFFLLLPQHRRSRALSREIANLSQQLQQRNYLVSEQVLRNEKAQEEKTGNVLASEWTNMCRRVSSFVDQDNLSHSSVDRIDYKMALFNVRGRLLRKARESNIGLPPDLGIEEEVLSNEDARKRMIQLRAVENIVDTALDLKINKLENIRPLPPVAHCLAPGGEPYIEEYPVQLAFFGSVENLYDMIERILEPGTVYMLRRLRAEEPADPQAGRLQMKATLSALVFVKTPGQVLGAAAVKRRVAPVTGH